MSPRNICVIASRISYAPVPAHLGAYACQRFSSSASSRGLRAVADSVLHCCSHQATMSPLACDVVGDAVDATRVNADHVRSLEALVPGQPLRS